MSRVTGVVGGVRIHRRVRGGQLRGAYCPPARLPWAFLFARWKHLKMGGNTPFFFNPW